MMNLIVEDTQVKPPPLNFIAIGSRAPRAPATSDRASDTEPREEKEEK